MNRRAETIRRFRRWSAAVLLLVSAGCTPPGKPEPSARPIMPGEVVSFDVLYAGHCAACHGADGARGPAPPLNDSLFAAIIPDDTLEQVIRDGRLGTPMPAFARDNGGSLTAKQIRILADGIKKKWGAADVDPVALPPYRLTRRVAGQPAPGDRRRGEQVFARACASCHGADGTGGPDDDLRGGAINVPAFLALISDQALRRIIITGRPDLGMPNFAGTDGRGPRYQPLTSSEIDDLVALIAGWREAGTLAQMHDTRFHSIRSELSTGGRVRSAADGPALTSVQRGDSSSGRLRFPSRTPVSAGPSRWSDPGTRRGNQIAAQRLNSNSRINIRFE